MWRHSTSKNYFKAEMTWYKTSDFSELRVFIWILFLYPSSRVRVSPPVSGRRDISLISASPSRRVSSPATCRAVKVDTRSLYIEKWKWSVVLHRAEYTRVRGIYHFYFQLELCLLINNDSIYNKVPLHTLALSYFPVKDAREQVLSKICDNS